MYVHSSESTEQSTGQSTEQSTGESTGESTESTPVRSRGNARFLGGLVLLVLLGVGAWPHLAFLDAVPLQPDSLQWIEEGRTESGRWSEWTFHKSHFVGYRPLTALSFTADLELWGLDASGLRRTDLALHLAAAAALFLLARRLAGIGGATLATLLFLAHPASEEVVSFLARRSYSLATLGALAGLVLAARSVQRAPRGLLAAFFVGPCLAAGFFGNELGALLALVLPASSLAAARGVVGGRRRAVLVSLWGWAWLAAAVLVRQRVIGEVGGYPVEGSLLARAREALALYGSALTGRLDGASGGLGLVVLAVLVYHVAAAFRLALRPPRDFLAGALVLAIALYGGLVVSQGVWFPRQVYPVVALFALLIAVVANRLAFAPEGGRWRFADRLALAATIGVMCAASPLLHGPLPGRLAKAHQATATVDAIRAAVDGLPEGAKIDFVLASLDRTTETRTALRADWKKPKALLRRERVPFRWAQLLLEDRPLVLHELAYVIDPPAEPVPELVTARRPLVRLPGGCVAYAARGRRFEELPEGRREVQVQMISAAGRGPVYVWLYAPAGGGELVQVR